MTKDYVDKALKSVSHNRWMYLGILIAIGIGIFAGCESKTLGLGGESKVTRLELKSQALFAKADLAARQEQLNQDIVAFNSRVELGEADLDKKDELKQSAVELIGGIAGQAASGLPISIPAVISSVLGFAMLASGAVTKADSMKKDKVIEGLKAEKVNIPV